MLAIYASPTIHRLGRDDGPARPGMERREAHNRQRSAKVGTSCFRSRMQRRRNMYGQNAGDRIPVHHSRSREGHRPPATACVTRRLRTETRQLTNDPPTQETKTRRETQAPASLEADGLRAAFLRVRRLETLFGEEELEATGAADRGRHPRKQARRGQRSRRINQRVTAAEENRTNKPERLAGLWFKWGFKQGAGSLGE